MSLQYSVLDTGDKIYVVYRIPATNHFHAVAAVPNYALALELADHLTKTSFEAECQEVR